MAALGRKAEAIAVLQDLIASHPRDVTAHLELGRLLHREGRLDEAAAVLEATVALSTRRSREEWNTSSPIRGRTIRRIAGRW